MKPTAIILAFMLAGLAAGAQSVLPPFPSLPPAPAPVKHYHAAKTTKGATLLMAPKAVIAPPKGVWLAWQPPTNSFYVFESCTNMAAPQWYFRTNTPLNTTEVFIESSKAPSEFYRAYTALPTSTGGFYVQTLDVLTNAP